MNVSLGTDQTEEKFRSRIEDYHSNIVTVHSRRTQGVKALLLTGGVWYKSNATDGPVCVDQVNIAPPSGVQITKYVPIIQEQYTHHDKKGGSKTCYVVFFLINLIDLVDFGWSICMF